MPTILKAPSKPIAVGKIFLYLMSCGVLFFFLFWTLSLLLKTFPEPIGSRADLLIAGAKETLILTLYSGALGLCLGILGALGTSSRIRIFRFSAQFFIWLIRGTPLLVQILVVYFAVPTLFPWFKLNEREAAIFALALNVGAYNAEVIRAGILAVPSGQREAAQTLGLSSWQTMRFIILPQAFRIVVPPLVNNLVALLKDSSLASTIGLLELSLAGNRISSETFLPVPVLATTSAIYLVLTTTLTGITGYLEKKII